MAWLDQFEGTIGGALLTRTKGDFDGANPYPGSGVTEHYQKQSFFLPQAYGVAPLTKDLHFGVGAYAPYGLGLRWQNPEVFTGASGTSPVSSTSFSGRFISQNAVIQSLDTNANFSYRLLPSLSIAAGAVYRLSKVQLERNQGAIDPFTNSFQDVAHIKLNSDIWDNHGWGWNVGLMYKPTPSLSFGFAYRSHIKIDYDLTANFTQRTTGNAAFDAAVAASLPHGTNPALTSIDFPASMNIGTAYKMLQDCALTISVEADWTQWTSFKTLDITFPTIPTLGLHRVSLWKDAWAFRGGVEYKISKGWAIRGGYYYDQTPQPTVDAGPILSDNNRNAITAGFGYNTEHWGVDVGEVYILFQDRNTTAGNTDRYYGIYKEQASVTGLNFRLAF